MSAVAKRLLPQKGELWQHVKTGGQYYIREIGKLQSKRAKFDMQECAIYSAKNEDCIWIRPLEDFVDMQDNNCPRFFKVKN